MTSHLSHPLTSTGAAGDATGDAAADTSHEDLRSGPPVFAVRVASGTAAVLASAALTAFALMAHAMPPGYPGRHRETEDELFFVGILLSAVAFVGLTCGVHDAMRGRSVGRAGRIVIGAGIATALSMWPMIALVGDSAWWCVVLGVLLVITGFALVAIAGMRAGLLPVPVGAFVLIGVLLFPFFNGEDARVLLVLPFAGALALTGLWVLATAERVAHHRR